MLAAEQEIPLVHPEDKETIMTTETTRPRRPRFSNVIALIALFAVLGGSAYAGSKAINGKKIKKGTVTSKALKDKTIKTADISDAAVEDLQGQQGPQGPQGEQGPAGVIEPGVVSDDGGTNLPDNTSPSLGSFTLPAASQYILEGKAQLFAGPGVTSITCRIEVGGNEVDRVIWNPPADNTRTPVSLLAVASGQNQDAELNCEADGGTGNASFVRLLALETTG
jgi:hypothetical protein